MILMSIEEFAEYLGESKRTIYRYIQTGDCPPYIRLTKKNIKFDKKDVDAWLESKKINPQKNNIQNPAKFEKINILDWFILFILRSIATENGRSIAKENGINKIYMMNYFM